MNKIFFAVGLILLIGCASQKATTTHTEMGDTRPSLLKILMIREVMAWDPGKRGAGDIAYVSPYNSGLDGLGAAGSGAHSLSETMDLRTFKDLTKRAVILIYRLTQDK